MTHMLISDNADCRGRAASDIERRSSLWLPFSEQRPSLRRSRLPQGTPSLVSHAALALPLGSSKPSERGSVSWGPPKGKTLRSRLRNAEGKNEQLSALADELLRLEVHVILAVNTPAAQAAKQATATVPIVITRIADPVHAGLVASLARPGGNVTGLSVNSQELSPKRMQLLKEIVPGLSRVAVLFNANNPGASLSVADMEQASSQLGLEVLPLPFRGPSDFLGAFQAVIRAGAEALAVLDDTAVTQHREQILTLAAQHALPVGSIYKDFAEAGGLIAYGPNLPTLYQRAAYYVDRILKGAKPADLPVEQPTKINLVLNLKVAQALGITMPPSLLILADEVIR